MVPIQFSAHQITSTSWVIAMRLIWKWTIRFFFVLFPLLNYLAKSLMKNVRYNHQASVHIQFMHGAWPSPIQLGRRAIVSALARTCPTMWTIVRWLGQLFEMEFYASSSQKCSRSAGLPKKCLVHTCSLVFVLGFSIMSIALLLVTRKM